MVVCMACCKGKGFASTIMNVTITVTFYLHLIGMISPHWYCDGGSCSVHGLNYMCENESTDLAFFPMVLLVTISSLLLTVVFCFIMSFTSYKNKSMSKCLAVFFSVWYIIQELISMAALIYAETEFEKVGWSAYIFLLPGIIGMVIMIILIVYFLCKRDDDSDDED